MTTSSIPRIILEQLAAIELGTGFTGRPPCITSSTSGKSYFVKLGTSSEVEQFAGEAASLDALHAGAPGLVPRLLAHGVDSGSGRPYFISEYKDIAYLNNNAGAKLGTRLAELHSQGRSPGGRFGFQVPTFCGATRMRNGWYDSWEKCFDVMIGDLLDKLGRVRRSAKDTYICSVIPKLLGPLKIEPVILHGDLWSGNAGVDKATGEPIIFDPSSYYGHNEADLSIARIFGGFPSSFYQKYHDRMPKTEPIAQYDLRGDLYELFHYLNHTVIFGGSYAGSAMRKMDKLLSALGSDRT
ncbi:fructosamine kinase [Fistulina hepatica ATCC 64428]|uniref:protein-ribulosamine 3-kinase n=1 Tax=Fistulina hepatica ATCC 64428 TaxID=1128425 RepID=A0A0D7AH34_9AGAR|nr:fructosamine kinase [Fistulina hepatica ATCC 64428]